MIESVVAFKRLFSTRWCRLLILLIATGFVAYGCSKKANGPHQPALLPRMSIWENPIADSSSVYLGTSDDTGRQFNFNIIFPESAISRLGRVDDIALCYRVDYCNAGSVSAYDDCDTSWHPIEIWPGSLICPAFTMPMWSRWLLSCIANDPSRCFLATTKTLKVVGDVFWTPQARLLRYRDDFAFIVLTADHNSGYHDLGFDGRSIWTARALAAGESLIVLDQSGDRDRTVWLPGVRFKGMAWSGTEFWAVTLQNPPRVVSFSVDGAITKELTVPVGYWDTIRGGIAWADSLIWLPRNDGNYPYPPIMKMIAIDPIASVASGQAVVIRELPAPADFRNMAGLTAANGELLVVAGQITQRLYRMQLDGSLDEGRSLKVAAGPFTWDGESLWMLHSGPVMGPGSHGSLLSRFSLE